MKSIEMLNCCGLAAWALGTHIKYTRSVEIAVPASSAAESTSVLALVHGHCDDKSERRTVILSPKRKISSPNDILRQEADYGPGYIINSACGRYETDSGEHKAWMGLVSEDGETKLGDLRKAKQEISERRQSKNDKY